MKAPFKQRHPLVRPLTAMTVSILILFSLSYFFVTSSSDALTVDTEIIRITSTQKSLSQQIINTIAANNLNAQIDGPSLDSLIDSFKKLETDLPHIKTQLNISAEQTALYNTHQSLNIAYKKFSDLLDENMIDIRGENFVSLINAQNVYLKRLDEFTNNLTGYSNTEIKSFKTKELYILVFSILLVLLQIRFIFLPAIQKIEKQNNALREISFTQAHIIRRPLTNILSLLNMTLEKKQDSYNTQLLTLAKKEADELDAVIKNNIYKSDKNYRVKT